jgi:NAD(P)-dependent dehydrogenase (short-subunit alcohol dehydrogenase family)
MDASSLPDSRVWLITGCSSGFGLALARAALARGLRVVATARQVAVLQPLAEEYPATCRIAPLDVTVPSQIAEVLQTAVEEFGRVDVVVNNAGYGVVGAFEELSPEQIERNFQTNFFGALEVIRQALPHLRSQGAGMIVNISAAAVISNYAGFAAYGASKWALEGASEALAAELKPLGIKVMVVQPGPFRTDFIGRSLEKGERSMPEYERTSGKFIKLLESMNGKQPGDPERAAKAIIEAVETPEPPFRLILGKYANEKARQKYVQAEKERAAWEEVGLAADFAAGAGR